MRMIYKTNSDRGYILDDDKALQLVEHAGFYTAPQQKVVGTVLIADIEYESLLRIAKELKEQTKVKTIKKVTKKAIAKKKVSKKKEIK